ncbi:MAG: hypothetical protein EXR99_12495 [Gemmataceae bacterium]|nr:hypothetical protein [Gemmataceae bacterium]
MSRFKELLKDYLAGPGELRAAVSGMNKDQVLARPIAGKMSTLEVVCHLTDFDPIMADRMKRVIALENPVLTGADENLFLKSLAYQERDLQEELALLEITRAQMGRILNHAGETALARKGNHTERGEVSLEKLLEGAIRHVRHHLGFILEKKKALGIENPGPKNQNSQ